jgi:hypothetical protein
MNPEVLRAALDDLVTSQPWAKKHANTITAAWTGALMLGWLVTDSVTDAPPWITAALGVLLYVGQVLGVYKTKNGVTPSVVDKVTEVVEVRYGRHAAPE